jgi:hypothetical protein
LSGAPQIALGHTLGDAAGDAVRFDLDTTKCKNYKEVLKQAACNHNYIIIIKIHTTIFDFRIGRQLYIIQT